MNIAIADLIRAVRGEEVDLSSIQLLNGGSVHPMWSVKSKNGVYAIKEINRHMDERSSFPKSYESAEEIAFKFYKAGIPAVPSYQYKNQYVQEVDEKYFLIYPFIDGRLVAPERATIGQVSVIGDLLAKMHNLEWVTVGDHSVYYDLYDDSHWQGLLGKLSDSVVDKLMPNICYWNRQFKDAIPGLNERLVVSHGDLHSLNIMWANERSPYIIDWERAGLMNPLLELVSYAMEWSGVIPAARDFTKTEVAFKSYIKSSGQTFSREAIEQSFYAWIGHYILGWTEINLRRMLGEFGDNREVEIGRKIVFAHMLPCIDFLKENQFILLEKVQSLMA